MSNCVRRKQVKGWEGNGVGRDEGKDREEMGPRVYLLNFPYNNLRVKHWIVTDTGRARIYIIKSYAKYTTVNEEKNTQFT